jgi:hypothetical protein
MRRSAAEYVERSSAAVRPEEEEEEEEEEEVVVVKEAVGGRMWTSLDVEKVTRRAILCGNLVLQYETYRTITGANTVQ